MGNIIPIMPVAIDRSIKRVVATSGAAHAFSPDAVDFGYQRRLLSVSMTPDNLAAFASDQLEFDDTSRWVDANVGRIRVHAEIIGGEQDELIGIDHARTLAETLPDAQLVTVDGGHMIPYSHPKVIAVW